MFANRQEAGELLAHKLEEFKEGKDTVVFAIARGGVVTGWAVASVLKLPLDIIVVKKIGLPDNPELAIGAVGPGGAVYWDENLCQKLNINKKIRNQQLRIKEKERNEGERLLRGNRPLINLRNKTVILVDDGVATGATVMAAAKSLKKMQTKAIILATPVIAKDTLKYIMKYFDDVIFFDSPAEFYAVGQFYQNFPQIEDEEVCALLSS